MLSRFVTHPPRLYRMLFGNAEWRVPASKRQPPVVYLTFDDGPVPEVTPQVLDILDKYGVKATFFMVGDNAQRNPHLVKAITDARHAVGNHTMHHLQSLHSTLAQMLDDVAQADAVLPPNNLFRPPHGLMKPSHLRALRATRRIIMYDIVTRDYARNNTPQGVIDSALRHVRNGSIIVLHDSIKAAPNMLPALPRLIAALRARGYAFAPL